MADKKLILKKLLILVIAMFVLDRAVGALLAHFFFTKKNGFDARANYIINKATDDVLIFGSSRASEHYNSTVLQDSLHVSVFNAGRDLSYILYHYALLESALKRYSPKLVVLDTRPNEFVIFKAHEDLDRLNVLLPFYDSHPEIRNIVLLRDEFEKYKLWSKMYPYNSLILSELVELLPIARYKKDDSDRGYIAKTGRWTGPKPDYTVDDKVNPVAAAYYKKFILLCKAKKIKLVLVYSPINQKLNTATNKNIAFARQTAKQYHVPLISYLDDPEFNNPAYFIDGLHLNREGSTLFSKRIAGQLRAVLNGK